MIRKQLVEYEEDMGESKALVTGYYVNTRDDKVNKKSLSFFLSFNAFPFGNQSLFPMSLTLFLFCNNLKSDTSELT